MPPKGDATYTRRPGKGLFQQMKEVLAEPIARHDRAGQSDSHHSDAQPSTEQTPVHQPHPPRGGIRIGPTRGSGSRSTPTPVVSPDGGSSHGQSAVSQAPLQARLRIVPHGNM